MEKNGFSITDEAAVQCFVTNLLELRPVFNRFSQVHLTDHGTFLLHDFTESWTLVELEMHGPANRKHRGMPLLRHALRNHGYTWKAINMDVLKELHANRAAMRRIDMYGDGPLVIHDGQYEKHVDFAPTSLQDALVTSTIRNTMSQARTNVTPIGPLPFAVCETETLASADPVRICLNPDQCWVETPAELASGRLVPSVRFDLFGRQLVPMKDVEASSVCAYLTNPTNHVYHVEIVRANRWFRTCQSITVYHYYRSRKP